MSFNVLNFFKIKDQVSNTENNAHLIRIGIISKHDQTPYLSIEHYK